MAEVILKHICKIYDGNICAVKDCNIEVKDKEFVALVGPSGCGKSTTLRMIAGLEDISDGELYIDGKLVNNVPPKDRDIAMVFQNYALYPHMTVYENMAFGLKIQKLSKEEIDKRVRNAAQILGIEDLLSRKPKALSGGQCQRVSVGRAIVREPKVFLFDEPLSNLDAKLRVQMRAEISKLHHELQATMLYVTHDQVEALTMADKIVVMNRGVVQQIGSPMDLYNQPANKFVAGFIGSPPMNFIDVNVENFENDSYISNGDFKIKLFENQAKMFSRYCGNKVVLGIRPENLEYCTAENEPQVISGIITVVEPLGSVTNVFVQLKNTQIVASINANSSVRVGDRIFLKPDMSKAKFFDFETEEIIQ